MKIKEVTASMGRTIQLKQYEPINFHVSIRAEVDEDESVQKAFSELMNKCKVQLNAQTLTVKQKQESGEINPPA